MVYGVAQLKQIEINLIFSAVNQLNWLFKRPGKVRFPLRGQGRTKGAVWGANANLNAVPIVNSFFKKKEIGQSMDAVFRVNLESNESLSSKTKWEYAFLARGNAMPGYC